MSSNPRMNDLKMGGGERGRKPVVGPSPRKRRQEATTTTGAADDICLDYDVCDDEFEAEYDENYSDEAMMETEDDDTAAVDSTAVLPESSAVVEGMPPSLDDTIVDETDGDSSSKHAKLEGIIANVNIDDADVSMSSDKSCRSSMEVSTSEENSKTKRGKDSSDTELDYDSYSSVDEMERAGGEDSQTDGDNSQTDDWNYSSSSSNSSDRSSTSKDDSDSLSMDEVFGMNLERSENIKTVDEIESPDISESESPEQQNVVTETTDVNFESNGTKAIANRLHCSGDSMSASESKVNHFEIATCNKSKDIHVSFESTEHEKICAGESDAQTPKNLDNVLMDIPLRHCKGELDLRLPTPISSSNVTKYQSVSEHVLICRVKKVHNRRSSVHEMGRKSAERLIPESPSKRRSSVHELNFSKEEKCNELSSHDFESCEKSVTETKSEPCTETMNLNRSKDYVHMNKDDCDNKFSKKDKEVNMDERSDRRRGRKEHSAERPDRKRSDHRKEKKHKDHKESVRRHDVDKSQRRDPPEEKSHKSRRGDIDRSIPSNEKEIRSRQSEPRNREGSRHSGTRDMSKRTDRRTGSHRQETDEIKPRKHESDRKREEKCVNEPRRHSSTRERRQKHAEKHKCEPEEKSGRKIDIREDRRKECLDKQTSRTREERDRENAPQRRHSGDRPSGRKEMRKERDEIQRRRRYSDERSDRPRCRSDRHGSRGGSTPRSSDRVKLIVEEKERRGLDCQKHERSNERGSTPSSRRRSDRHGSRSGSTPGNSDRAKDIEERSERGGLDSEKQERSNEKGSSLSSRSKRERHRSLGGSAPRSSDRVKQIEDERERRGLDGEKHERSNEKRSSPSSRSRRERHGSRGGSTPRSSDRVKQIENERERSSDSKHYERSNEKGSSLSSRSRSERHGSRGGSTKSIDRVKEIEEGRERTGLDGEKHERPNEKGSSPSSKSRSERRGSIPKSDRVKEIEGGRERTGLHGSAYERSHKKCSSSSCMVENQVEPPRRHSGDYDRRKRESERIPSAHENSREDCHSGKKNVKLKEVNEHSKAQLQEQKSICRRKEHTGQETADTEKLKCKKTMEAQIDDDHMKSKNQSEIENKTDRHFISEIQPLDASDSCHFVLNYIFDNHCSIHEKRNEQSSVDERNKCHCQLVLDYLYGQMSDVTNDLMNSFQMRVHHIAGPDLPVKLQKYSDLCQQRLKQLFRTPAMSQIENASTFLDSCKVKLNTLFDKSVGILFPTSVGLSSESKVSTEGKTDVSSVSNESLSKATAVKSKPAPRTTVLGVGLIPTNPRAKLKQGTQLRNVLTRMQDIKGPISVLYTALQERLRVKVWTRGARQLRGYCLGYIVAFDKYWNLAMVDVDEIYVKPFRKKPDRQKPANNQKQTNLEPVDPGMSTNSAPCYPHVPVASDNPQLELRVYDNTNSEQVDLAALSNKLKQFRSELLDLSGTEKSSSLSIERTRKHRSDLTETRTSSDVLFQTSVESFTTNPEFMRMAEVNSVEMEKLNDNRDDNHNVAEKSDDKPKRPAAVGTVVPNYHDPWCRKTIALPNRWGKCIERHVNQLFLRGDSVVSVGILE